MGGRKRKSQAGPPLPVSAEPNARLEPTNFFEDTWLELSSSNKIISTILAGNFLLIPVIYHVLDILLLTQIEKSKNNTHILYTYIHKRTHFLKKSQYSIFTPSKTTLLELP